MSGDRVHWERDQFEVDAFDFQLALEQNKSKGL